MSSARIAPVGKLPPLKLPKVNDSDDIQPSSDSREGSQTAGKSPTVTSTPRFPKITISHSDGGISRITFRKPLLSKYIATKSRRFYITVGIVSFTLIASSLAVFLTFRLQTVHFEKDGEHPSGIIILFAIIGVSTFLIDGALEWYKSDRKTSSSEPVSMLDSAVNRHDLNGILKQIVKHVRSAA
eukprot:105103_1